MQNNQPYRHPAIESIIRHVFFHGSSATTYGGIYRSSIPDLDEPEVPIPMVALAATAVSMGPTSWCARLKVYRYMPLLMTGAATGARFRRASTRTSTAGTSQHLKASRPPTSVRTTRSLGPSIATVCEQTRLLWCRVSFRFVLTESNRRKSGLQQTVQPLALNMAELSTSFD